MTALATAIQPLWPLLEAYGEDPEPIFRAAGIDPAVLKRTNARLTVEACRAIWLQASSRLADPCFGVHYGEFWQPSMFGPLGYAWLTSKTLRQALDRFARYVDLVLERGAIELDDLSNGDVRVALSYEGSPITLPAIADSLLSLYVKLCRLNYGETFTPALVTIMHSPPQVLGPYFEYFKCPVEFDSERDSMVISRSVIDAELPSANPYLANLNEQETVRILAKLDKSRTVDRVKAAIIDELANGNVGIDSVADKLNMSSRTLNRQLHQQGVTFKELLVETRLGLATAYLSDESISLTQIAFLLGFAEQASFTRAYRRWTGHAPSEVRHQAAATNPTDTADTALKSHI